MSRKLIINYYNSTNTSVTDGIGERRTHNDMIRDAQKAIQSSSSVSNIKNNNDSCHCTRPIV